MHSLFDVSGKTAIVTGGSRGIGEMIATAYLQAGMKRVYITARKVEALTETQKRLSEFGECVAVAADLSTVDGVTAFAATVAEQTDAIDVLVNNAGATWGAPFEAFPESGWDRVMDLNVKGLFFLTQKLYPLLKKNASADAPARVINIASMDGTKVPVTDNFSYSTSKAAVLMLTRHMAKRMVRDHVHVNSISPGPFRSKMTAALLDAGGDSVAAAIPIKRIGEPEDLGGVALFLAARASQNTVGANIPCDGGLSTIT